MQQIVHQLLLEQTDRVRKVRSGLGLLKIESRALKSKLGAADFAERRAGFVASWQGIEKRLATDRKEMASKPGSEVFVAVGEELERCTGEVGRVRVLLERGEPGAPLEEALAALDRQREALDRSLDTLGRRLTAELDERLRIAYDRPS